MNYDISDVFIFKLNLFQAQIYGRC